MLLGIWTILLQILQNTSCCSSLYFVGPCVVIPLMPSRQSHKFKSHSELAKGKKVTKIKKQKNIKASWSRGQRVRKQGLNSHSSQWNISQPRNFDYWSLDRKCSVCATRGRRRCIESFFKSIWRHLWTWLKSSFWIFKSRPFTIQKQTPQIQGGGVDFP